MNAAEKEWDQLDTRLARYDQNSHQTLLLKMSSQIYPVKLLDMSGPPETFFSTLILELRGTKMDETWTQGSPQHK